jgi:hypothetical protein
MPRPEATGRRPNIEELRAKAKGNAFGRTLDPRTEGFQDRVRAALLAKRNPNAATPELFDSFLKSVEVTE